ncbi:MAG: tRNA (N(6)-L-threonylcarbamoyladenosine(37)-C(2))-methylthiotransferase MtaB [Campylobacteraceae bacterium]|jgi:MiaB-like tRNA modifying enzyme|nr:tRNA (N(6)-L-threonylcarbamoyladenosine(37)-C(2))-methylthiotransferase MtaB [Campylobacteraceae bacterium]
MSANARVKVFFKTFGCRTNIYDTEVMISSLKDCEVVENEFAADIVVVNSCTVTNGADSGVRNYISKQNREGKKVIFAGCGADTRGSELFEQKKIFGVMGHSEKENINELIFSPEPFKRVGVLTHKDNSIVGDFHDKSKAFVKIQEGCNFACSYCIIPSVRGKARSQDESKILQEVSRLAQNGFGEFVLTGTNIGSYGRDTDTTLGVLLQKISQVVGVKRVRLGSIEPVQIDDSFREILKEEWLEKHLHIALQHTNEEMLKIMRRRNSVRRDLALFEELSSLGFALGSDFITGHPGESEEVWQDAVENFKKFPLTHLHVFCYSKRDGTPSALMKNSVNGNIAKMRSRELESIVKEKNFTFRRECKTSLNILVEEQKEGYYTGFDQFYNRIFIKSSENITDKWININDYEVKKEGNYAKI